MTTRTENQLIRGLFAANLEITEARDGDVSIGYYNDRRKFGGRRVFKTFGNRYIWMLVLDDLRKFNVFEWHMYDNRKQCGIKKYTYDPPN